jgi:N-acetylglucosaminyldiphosphoundecaprenol N-acetyl-beta-D-mannosaminyltransferase
MSIIYPTIFCLKFNDTHSMNNKDVPKNNTPNRVNILGVGVDPITKSIAVDIINGWIERGEQHYICVTGVHGVMESQHDERLRQIHNKAGLVTPDGMPLVWLSAMKGYHGVERVYGPDLMLTLCKECTSLGYRHYLYGSTPDVIERLAQNLQQQCPAINIVGAYSPPFRLLTPDEDDEVVRQINITDPHIIWIGLSTPKQEYWMANHLGKILAPVMIGVGAAFDFHAGTKRQAPRWMQRIGMEWLFRLCNEPRRLWKRYLVNNPQFILLVLAQELGIKHYPI